MSVSFLLLDFVTCVLCVPACLRIVQSDSLVRCNACALHSLACLPFHTHSVLRFFQCHFGTICVCLPPFLCLHLDLGCCFPFDGEKEFLIWFLPSFLSVLPSRFVVTPLFVLGFVCYSEAERKEEAKKRLEKRENT